MATHKRKTHRGAAKRFTITAKESSSAATRWRHILTKKASGRKRQLAKSGLVAKADEHTVRKMLPYA